MAALVVAILIAAFTALYLWYKKAYYIPPVLEKMPGPSRIPVLGSAHHLAEYSAWQRLQEQFGDVFFVKILSNNVIAVCDPVLIQKAIHMPNVLQRSKFFEYDLKLLGPVLFCIDGEDWRTRRTSLNPHFRSQNINALFPVVAERSMRAVKALTKSLNKEINIDAVFSSVTLDVICHYLISTHMDAASGDDNLMTQAFHEINREALAIMLFPLNFYLPRLGKFKYLKAARKLTKFFDGVICDRRKDAPDEPRDILDALIANKLDDKAIRDEVTGLMFAGHDTTSHTLSFAIYLICKDPEILKKVMEEVNQLTFNDKGEIAKYEEVSGLKYLTACIKETLRLYPQGTAHPLTALEDTHLGDIVVPKDTVVLCQTYVVQHLEKYWPEASAFKPERFVAEDVQIVDGIAAHDAATKPTDEKKEEKKDEKKAPTYFPFLQGRHMCIGQHLAMLEMRVVLATFLKHLDFYVKPGYVPIPVQGLAFPPKDGLWVTPTMKKL